MAPLKVQLIHPGVQMNYNCKRKNNPGYRWINNDLIREWNTDKEHKRKFIHHCGDYVTDINSQPIKTDDLFFWGEWEGNSYFTPFCDCKNDKRLWPNGVHNLFHSLEIRGSQNTDPYIFGDNFIYAICRQNGQLRNLDPGSVILFGTVYNSEKEKVFAIDTVFVTSSRWHSSKDVCAKKGKEYSQIWHEESCEQFGDDFVDKNFRVYKSQTWWDNKDFFSFVPTRLTHDGCGFKRLEIDLNDPVLNLNTNTQGVSYLKECNLTPYEFWKYIIEKALEQDFVLGVRFPEPNIVNLGIPQEILEGEAC